MLCLLKNNLIKTSWGEDRNEHESLCNTNILKAEISLYSPLYVLLCLYCLKHYLRERWPLVCIFSFTHSNMTLSVKSFLIILRNNWFTTFCFSWIQCCLWNLVLIPPGLVPCLQMVSIWIRNGLPLDPFHLLIFKKQHRPWLM